MSQFEQWLEAVVKEAQTIYDIEMDRFHRDRQWGEDPDAPEASRMYLQALKAVQRKYQEMGAELDKIMARKLIGQKEDSDD
jgi:hypothetical protein